MVCKTFVWILPRSEMKLSGDESQLWSYRLTFAVSEPLLNQELLLGTLYLLCAVSKIVFRYKADRTF